MKATLIVGPAIFRSLGRGSRPGNHGLPAECSPIEERGCLGRQSARSADDGGGREEGKETAVRRERHVSELPNNPVRARLSFYVLERKLSLIKELILLKWGIGKGLQKFAAVTK